MSDNNAPQSYHVFVNFRGVDIRRGFLSHLVGTLRSRNVNTFVDDNLEGGDKIWRSLVRAIQGSSISLIIFSPEYASSRWCLEELVAILECKDKYEQIVIPVFYEVEPTNVRHQSSDSYKKAFADYEKKSENKVQIWRDALKTSADLSGIESSKFRNDAELIEEIVDLVQKKLVETPDNLKERVAIDERMATIKSWIREDPKHTHIIGIWGMGGIGKTTLAKQLYKELRSKYQGSCFLAIERNQSKKDGIISLVENIFSKLLGDDVKIDRLNLLPEYIRRTGHMKILIVLDDVYDSKLLEKLLTTLDNFELGSTIIVTTRDKGVLTSVKADKIYLIEPLSFDKALELFNVNAFNSQSDRHREYNELAKKVVPYAKGIPLVIKILAGHLRGKCKEEWMGMLDRLNQMPITAAYVVVTKLSYDALDCKSQQIFLDLACFFLRTNKPVNVGYLISLMKDNESDNSVSFHLERLKNKALITICEDNIVSMHIIVRDLVWALVRQEFAREPKDKDRRAAVRQELSRFAREPRRAPVRQEFARKPKDKDCQAHVSEEFVRDPGSRSRLWDPIDIYEALKSEKVNIATISIRTHFPTIMEHNSHNLLLHMFAKMRKLKFLEISTKDLSFCCDQLNLAKDLPFLAIELRFLCWEYYPRKSLPENFLAEKLVILKLPWGRMEKLWDGVKNLVNLKQVDLKDCETLKELPDLSKATNLEVLLLRGCAMLTSVHPSIFTLPKLEKLDLESCSSLTIVTSDSHLCSLSYLNLDWCVNLREFSVISENMKELRLAHTNVEELPLSFSNLQILDVEYCESLQTISKLPESLKTLNARYCKSLKTVLFPSKAVEQLKENRTQVLFWNCLKLDEQSLVAIGLNAQINMEKFAKHHLKTPNNDSYQAVYVYPGRSIPEWLEYKTTKDYIIIDLSSGIFIPLRGFILCFVLGEYRHLVDTLVFYVSISYGEDESEKHCIRMYAEFLESTIESDHVCVMYDQILSAFLNTRAKNQTRFKIKVETGYQFYKVTYIQPEQVLQFGVCPIHTSGYNSFIQQMGKHFPMSQISSNKRNRAGFPINPGWL